MKITKLHPTNLYITTDISNELPDGYKYVCTYHDYEFDNSDIKKFLASEIKEVTLLGFGVENELVLHYFDYVDNEYQFMYNEGHSLQSLIISNSIEFDDQIPYKLLKKC